MLAAIEVCLGLRTVLQHHVVPRRLVVREALQANVVLLTWVQSALWAGPLPIQLVLAPFRVMSMALRFRHLLLFPDLSLQPAYLWPVPALVRLPIDLLVVDHIRIALIVLSIWISLKAREIVLGPEEARYLQNNRISGGLVRLLELEAECFRFSE